MALVSETFNALVDWNDPLVAQERDLAAAAAPPAPLRNPFAKPLFKSDADRRAFQDGPFMRALRHSKIILRDREADRRRREEEAAEHEMLSFLSAETSCRKEHREREVYASHRRMQAKNA